MTLPFAEHFNAALPGVDAAVRITSLYDAQVFSRRWVIRDKDRALKKMLRRLERVNSARETWAALADFKRALMTRGLFPGDAVQPTAPL